MENPDELYKEYRHLIRQSKMLQYQNIKQEKRIEAFKILRKLEDEYDYFKWLEKFKKK